MLSILDFVGFVFVLYLYIYYYSLIRLLWYNNYFKKRFLFICKLIIDFKNCNNKFLLNFNFLNFLDIYKYWYK